jgi:sulfate transport system permease protein
VKWLLRLLAVGYVFLLVAWPVAMLARRTFENGFSTLSDALSDPSVTGALTLTLRVALVAVVINLVFGVTISLLLVRYEFPGKRVLSALIDLPLAVSPVVVGLALLLVYNGRTGWFGPTLEAHGIQVMFSMPSMVMATCFVSLPLVVREVVPVLTEIGDDQEQAARSLGAGAVQTLRRITLPAIKWAVVYGVVLTFARSIGEYGALKIVSGNLIGQTQTATLYVHDGIESFHTEGAYAVSLVLAAVSFVLLVGMDLIRRRLEAREGKRA